MRLIEKVLTKGSSLIRRVLNRSNYSREILVNHKGAMKDLLESGFLKKLSPRERQLGKRIEHLRNQIVIDTGRGNTVSTYGSPRSGSRLVSAEGKVIPGLLKESSIEGVAKTGTKVLGGIQLGKIIAAFGGGSVLELGTNTGLSGCYFLAEESMSELVTVEGSPDLCTIAAKNMSSISDRYVLRNQLFEEAIIELKEGGKKFDFVFLDGQHEESATIFYTDLVMDLLSEKGTIIYDDIYWSEGMHAAWMEVSSRPVFNTTIDLASRGVCSLKKLSDQRTEINLCDYVGKPSIQRPGW